jgi:hypothetical protein
MNKKAIACFELILMVVSVFAFSFIISGTTPGIEGVQENDSSISEFLLKIFGHLKSPMIPVVSAQAAISQPSVCCEKTKDGAYCINTDEANCDNGFKSAPSSCETTSYCRLGTCYESEEGICMANTPQRVCDENGGTWDIRELNDVPQCQLGCCIIAEQAAFVPLVRCKRLSTLFGVANDYRADINNEVQCIATAQAQDVGACVYEKDFERLCEFTTRGECGAVQEVETVGGNISDGIIKVSGEKKFYKDYLCSAEELNTACAKQTSTGCFQGKVYEFDSCGNRENVYSSDKVMSWNWGRVAEPEEICEGNNGLNKNCGNCEYLLGSRCAKFDGLLGIGKPSGSDYYCQTTNCKDREGNDRMNGESWCVNDGLIGYGSDPAGSRYYKEVCVDGEIRVEPCADFRNEICISSSIETSAGNFGTAGCVVNRWQDCWKIDDEDDCLNVDQRDCTWLPGVTGMVLGGGGDAQTTGFSNPTASNTAFSNPTAGGSFTGNVVAPITDNGVVSEDVAPDTIGYTRYADGDDVEKTVTNRRAGICVPNFPPGLEFWKQGNVKQMCGIANAKCVVTYKKGLLGDWSCDDNCECLEEGWASDANRVCVGLGDCGGYVNFQGKYTDDGYKWVVDGDNKEFSPNNVNKIISGFTGLVVGGFGMITGGVGLTQTIIPIKAGSSGVGGIASYTGKLSEAAAAQLELPIGEPYTVSQTAAGGLEVSIPASGDVISLSAEEGSTFLANSNLQLETVKSKGFLSSKLGLVAGSGADALVSGFQWAAVAYLGGQLIGPLIGLDKENTKALSASLAAGFGTYKTLATYAAKDLGFLSAHPALVGIGIGVAIFMVMYKKEKVEIVEFNCLPWQAPTGGDVCEKCNDDTLPCSEYRCRALGQNCELVNPGSNQERCVTVRNDDVDPPIIMPNYAELSMNHSYTNVKNSPPGPGFNIVNLGSGDGCLKAFTPLKFGVNTDEPAQCKIDYKHTLKFDDMASFIGGSNFYAYNHSEQFALPGAVDLVNASFVLENGKEWQFYIRCKDKKGNENSAEYAVKFCIDPTPDSTAPEIKATSIINGGCVAEEKSTANVEFYINEPAECRWSKTDQDYDNMLNGMTCSSELYQMNALQLFICKANLTGIPRDLATFYVRCKDQLGKDEKDRNENAESYVFSLRGSTGLKLTNLHPNGTVFGAVRPAPVELYAETLFGCNDGQAICYYSTVDKDNNYIQFFDTDKEDGIHTQRLDLNDGAHKYYIKCVDEGGNVVKDSVDFKLDIDENAPVVARVYEEDELLKLVTVRDSECVYSFDDCDYSFVEGTLMPYANSTVHVAEWNEDRTYYIKCRDEFRNEDADCSIVVRPSRNFL